MPRTVIDSDTLIVDIEEYRGDTIVLPLHYEGYDFTGASAVWYIKEKPTDTESVLTVTSDDGGVQLGVIEDINMYASISDAQSANLEPKIYSHALVLTDTLGGVNTYAFGQLIIKAR